MLPLRKLQYHNVVILAKIRAVAKGANTHFA